MPHPLAPPRAAANRSALTLTENSARAILAPGGTNASLLDLKGTTHTQSVPSSAPPPKSCTTDPTYTLMTKVNTSVLAKEISKYPNQQLATCIVNSFNNGFAGYPPPNLNSALQHHVVGRGCGGPGNCRRCRQHRLDPSNERSLNYLPWREPPDASNTTGVEDVAGQRGLCGVVRVACSRQPSSPDLVV